jgi:hypothetical protein
MTGVFAHDHAGGGIVGEMRVELKAEEIFSFLAGRQVDESFGSFSFCVLIIHPSFVGLWFRPSRHRRSGKNFPQVQAACPNTRGREGRGAIVIPFFAISVETQFLPHVRCRARNGNRESLLRDRRPATSVQ